jgi:choline dehydrogenase-like flavoprotein
MGASPDSSCLDESGRYHHLDNLYVADMSIFPTSLGVPPQISAYAAGFYVASGIL